jgi:hypothetical protein
MAISPFLIGHARGTNWTHARVEEELAALDSLRFFKTQGHYVKDGALSVTGTLSFTQEETGRSYSLRIRLEYPTKYPWDIPIVFDEDKQFRPSANGHQFADYSLCLSFLERGEFALGSKLLASEILSASLVWMDKRFIFERTGVWPGEAEEHGWLRPTRKLLIEEAARSGSKSASAWADWIVAGLITPQYGNGCPCCSGRRFVTCHRRMAMLTLQFLFWLGQERGKRDDRTTLEAA